MMGPWAIAGALLLGARLVIYEGAPDFPGPDRLWDIVARHRVTHLGLSPTVIRALMAHGEEPVRGHDRSSLRVLGSTGEPWNPEPWWWYFREVGEGRCPIINYSGGTEVSGGIVGGNVIGPIKPASFSGPCIGTAADVVDETGRPVRGAVGELVIRAPLPGMTRGFWNDRARYEETYWSRWPGIWAHGDWASIDADGFWYIHGRSDDTLKVAGKRVGPAEVESAAVSHPAVLEAAAIGVPARRSRARRSSSSASCDPGETDDDGLRAAIAATIAGELGKPLKPEVVAVVRALPKTRSGKVMRRVIRAAWLGEDPGDLSALDRPGGRRRRSGPRCVGARVWAKVEAAPVPERACADTHQEQPLRRLLTFSMATVLTLSTGSLALGADPVELRERDAADLGRARAAAILGRDRGHGPSRSPTAEPVTTVGGRRYWTGVFRGARVTSRPSSPSTWRPARRSTPPRTRRRSSGPSGASRA